MRALEGEAPMRLVGSIDALHGQLPRPSQTLRFCFAFCLHSTTALGDCEELPTVSEAPLPQLHVVLVISASSSTGHHLILVCVGLCSLSSALTGGVKLALRSTFLPRTVSLALEPGLPLGLQGRLVPIGLEFWIMAPSLVGIRGPEPLGFAGKVV